MKKRRKLIDRFIISGCDESAFMLNTFRILGWRKHQERLSRRLHKDANELHKMIGEKPKRYKQIRHRKLMEE